MKCKPDLRSSRHGDRFLLGLAVSALGLSPGQTRSAGELAAFCGVTKSCIQLTEGRALRKVRHAFGKWLVELAELRDCCFPVDRRPARKKTREVDL